MKIAGLLFTLAMSVGCSSPPGDVDAPVNPPAAAKPSDHATATSTALASGVVEAVDVAARTITIAHEPVEALRWPAMTMTFKAPDADLGSFKQGDHVAFEFSSTGMNGTITTIERQ